MEKFPCTKYEVRLVRKRENKRDREKGGGGEGENKRNIHKYST